MKIALVMPGNLDCYKVSIKPMFENFIKVNNCDVFMLASKTSSMKVTNHILNGSKYKITHTEEDEKNIKNCFGDHLKELKYIEDIPNYKEELESQIVKLNERTSWVEYKGKFIQYYSPEKKQIDEPIAYIDRFVRMKYLVKMLEDYELKNNFKYDYIIRFRVDMLLKCPIFDINKYIKNTGAEELYWDNLEALWAGTPKVMKYMLENIVETIGQYRVGVETERGYYCLCRISQTRKFVEELPFPVKITNIPSYIGVTLFKEHNKIFIKSHPESEPIREKEGKTSEEFYGVEYEENIYYPILDETAPYLFVYTYYQS